MLYHILLLQYPKMATLDWRLKELQRQPPAILASPMSPDPSEAPEDDFQPQAPREPAAALAPVAPAPSPALAALAPAPVPTAPPLMPMPPNLPPLTATIAASVTSVLTPEETQARLIQQAEAMLETSLELSAVSTGPAEAEVPPMPTPPFPEPTQKDHGWWSFGWGMIYIYSELIELVILHF